MNTQSRGVVSSYDDNSGNSSVVAAQLVEAACCARDGDCEAAKAHIARALALLQGQLTSLPASVYAAGRAVREIVRGSLVSWQTRRITTHIEAHLTERIRTEDLAALLNLSSSHFSRAFKCTFGVSVHGYLVRRRIELAQALMLTTCKPLSEIALSCGMSDQSHFTRAFGRIVGETPHAWRRVRRGEIVERWGETDRSEGQGGSGAPAVGSRNVRGSQ